MDREEIKNQMDKIKWFHSMDLGHGLVTPGRDNTAIKLEMIKMPSNLTGLSVLDIGAWDGFFSFEAERRGARRVLAVDSFCWNGEGWGTKAGFLLARKALESHVEDREMEVLDLSPETVGTFDLVLFLGVLYHMKYPQRALERVASVTADRLIIETHVDFLTTPTPALAYYPGNELDNDYTNWCGPNVAALEWMLREVGFTDLQRVLSPSRRGRIRRAFKKAFIEGKPFLRAYRQGRVVIHARKHRKQISL